MKIPVVARLRLPDGREFDVHIETSTDYPDYEDAERFYWTDGNAGCDCNKALYLDREHNLGLEDEHDTPCGDTIELLSLKVGGREVLD